MCFDMVVQGDQEGPENDRHYSTETAAHATGQQADGVCSRPRLRFFSNACNNIVLRFRHEKILFARSDWGERRRGDELHARCLTFAARCGTVVTLVSERGVKVPNDAASPP